jgi:4,5-DOPA dioxygenase extradiol
MSPTALPVIYVSHGAPTFALEPGELGPQLAAVGQRLKGVRAVVVVSAHWLTQGGMLITGSAQPPTMHDFGGFPAPLYALSYPAPGAPELAQELAAHLSQAGFRADVHPSRGLDHGVWVPLMHMLPAAPFPVVQLSMPHPMTPELALRIGRALGVLRQQGGLLVASGSLTHNLYEVRRGAAPAAGYVQEFVDWVRQAVREHKLEALAAYREQAPHALRAHPTDEHYWPLVIAMAASDAQDPVELIDGGIRNGVLSMDAYVWGLPPAAPAAPQSCPSAAGLRRAA